MAKNTTKQVQNEIGGSSSQPRHKRTLRLAATVAALGAALGINMQDVVADQATPKTKEGQDVRSMSSPVSKQPGAAGVKFDLSKGRSWPKAWKGVGKDPNNPQSVPTQSVPTQSIPHK